MEPGPTGMAIPHMLAEEHGAEGIVGLLVLEQLVEAVGGLGGPLLTLSQSFSLPLFSPLQIHPSLIPAPW